MTPLNIKCLDALEQQSVVSLYTNKGISQVDLASMFMVSRRSIQRVLEVHGVLHYNYDNTPSQQPKPKVIAAPQRITTQPSPTKQMNMVLTTTTTVPTRPTPEEEKRMLDFLNDHRIDLPRLAKLVHVVKEVADASRAY